MNTLTVSIFYSPLFSYEILYLKRTALFAFNSDYGFYSNYYGLLKFSSF